MGRVMKTMVLIVGLAGASAAEEQVRPPERYVRLGHYQCVCRQGDFEANLQTVIHGLELAADARVQILSFPESFLNGYVINPNGQIVAGAGLYDECLMVYNLDLDKKYRAGGTHRSRESARALLETLEQTLRETR